jgi:ribulose-phosphate 3-epimerase
LRQPTDFGRNQRRPAARLNSMPEPTAFQLLHELRPTLSVGMMTANLMALGSELALLERAGARLVHIDVMDGCFCPSMTMGPPLIKAMKTNLLKDAHLMIAEPMGKVAEFVAAGADIVTVHVEADRHIHRVLQQMRTMTNASDPSRGIVRGVALNPGTPLELLDPLLDETELILLLAVNPGWRGQSFIPSTFGRIEKTKKLVEDADKDILLAVDGGITRSNVEEVAKTEVDIIVTGSAVFDGKAVEANARAMLAALPTRGW